ERESGGTFLVGTHGRLFEVSSDYQIGEPADPYAAVGCGSEVALGALHATGGSKMTPHQRLEAALAAAERFSNGVRGPFVHVSTVAASPASPTGRATGPFQTCLRPRHHCACHPRPRRTPAACSPSSLMLLPSAARQGWTSSSSTER